MGLNGLRFGMRVKIKIDEMGDKLMVCDEEVDCRKMMMMMVLVMKGREVTKKRRLSD